MTSLPEPKNLDHHLGKAVLRRKPNVFKLFYKYENIPNVYQLSAGMPNEKLFPIRSVQAEAAHYDDLSGDSLPNVPVTSNDVQLQTAMQYGQTGGIPDLQKWLTEFVNETLKPRYAGGLGCMVSLGSTDGWYKVLQVLSNERHDDYPTEWRQGILTEEFTYSLASEAARVRGLNIVPISMDSEGMCPVKLDEALSNWDFSRGKKPHILYTVSIGQNPTGATAGQERRQEIYKICQKHDIIIVEDEPYWFLQFDGHHQKCYLSVDTDGRVIRLDSFSKNFVPGARMGWIVGQPRLITRIYQLAEEATQQPSGFAQVLMVQALNEWGHDGWLKWLDNLRAEYEERRNIMVDTLDGYKYVGDKLVLGYKRPAAGMFVWINMQFQNHPLGSKVSVVELAQALWSFNATHKQPVLITPGYFFAPSQSDAEHTAPFIRISYAPSEKGNLKRETEGFGRNVAEFWQITDEARIKELADIFPEKH